jgi:hypothetical protein
MSRTCSNSISNHVGTAAPGCPAGQSPAGLRNHRRRCLGGTVALGLMLLALPGLLSASDCIPIQQVSHHVGETKCVAGKVLKIRVGNKGVHFLDFCEDQLACPFTVVVFQSGLKDVGDVRRLAGRTIEIHGTVKLYEGRPEIILNHISQIIGGAAMIPPLPKNYDVENRGHYSAGHLRPTKKPAKTKATPSTTVTYGNDVEGEDPQ